MDIEQIKKEIDKSISENDVNSVKKLRSYCIWILSKYLNYNRVEVNRRYYNKIKANKGKHGYK